MKKRLLGLSLTLFVLFGLLVLQFYKLQIVEHDKWEKLARRQHYFILKEPFHRGTFYSNTFLKKGHPEAPQRLVIDIEKGEKINCICHKITGKADAFPF